jgi:hypothetical protein
MLHVTTMGVFLFGIFCPIFYHGINIKQAAFWVTLMPSVVVPRGKVVSEYHLTTTKKGLFLILSLKIIVSLISLWLAENSLGVGVMVLQ